VRERGLPAARENLGIYSCAAPSQPHPSGRLSSPSPKPAASHPSCEAGHALFHLRQALHGSRCNRPVRLRHPLRLAALAGQPTAKVDHAQRRRAEPTTRRCRRNELPLLDRALRPLRGLACSRWQMNVLGPANRWAASARTDLSQVPGRACPGPHKAVPTTACSRGGGLPHPSSVRSEEASRPSPPPAAAVPDAP
jgi:hypothetical protein